MSPELSSPLRTCGDLLAGLALITTQQQTQAQLPSAPTHRGSAAIITMHKHGAYQRLWAVCPNTKGISSAPFQAHT